MLDGWVQMVRGLCSKVEEGDADVSRLARECGGVVIRR